MNREVIITCAVTGAGDTAGKSPHVPVTPQAIAESALAAAKAGAAIVHLHVRDPATGKPGRDLASYREAVRLVRASATDVVINLTAGMGGDFVPDEKEPWRGGPGTDMAGPEERLAHVVELRPEICTLDCGSLNFSTAAYVSTPDQLRAMARIIKDVGVRPELEVFELGHIWMANTLIEEGLIDTPALFQLCMGIPYAAPCDVRAMTAMRDLLHPGSIFAAFGIGRMQMPMVAQAVMLGGHVRVGLEDNLWLDKGVLATNAMLVARAVEILKLLGCRVLGPEEARTKLGLRKPA